MKQNFLIKKSQCVSLMLVFLFTLISLLTDSNLIQIILIFLSFSLIFITVEKDSPVHLMFLIGYSSFLFFPAILNYIIFNTDTLLFFLSSIISQFFLIFTSGLFFSPVKNKNNYFYMYFVFCFLLVLCSIFDWSDLYFLGPFVMFFVLCLRKNNVKYNTFLFLSFLSFFVFYYIFGWNGFGRTVTFGMLITAFVYYCIACNITINKALITFLPILASLGMVDRKNLNFSVDFISVANDSAVSPYRLAATFIDHFNNNGFDFKGFFDQVVYCLFIYIPRDLWENKPNGFGFQYVVDNLDQYLVDAGHSIASTLIGDHIYFFGWWGGISALIVIYLISRMIRWFYNMNFLQGQLVVLFSCNMMVFVWGGVTSLSSRIVFPLVMIVPMLILSSFIIQLRSKK